MSHNNNSVILWPFVLLYTTNTFNVPEGIVVYAEDSEKAEESFLSAFLDASVVWVVQTASINDAYATYHEESAMEDAV